MNREKFYYWTLGGLILLNICLMGALWLGPKFAGPPGGPHHRGPGPKGLKHFAERELNLDAEQARQVDKLAIEHHRQMKNLMYEQRKVLAKYFESLSEETLENAKLLERAGQIEQEKIQITYQHFQDIKSILREDQKAAFPRVMDEAMNKLLLPPRLGDRPPPPPRRH